MLIKIVAGLLFSCEIRSSQPLELPVYGVCRGGGAFVGSPGIGNHLLNILIAPRLFDIVREMIVGHVAEKWALFHKERDVLQVPDVGLNLGITECAAEKFVLLIMFLNGPSNLFIFVSVEYIP